VIVCTSCKNATGWHDEKCVGRRVLDSGVGAGRFAERAAAKNAEVYRRSRSSEHDAPAADLGAVGTRVEALYVAGRRFSDACGIVIGAERRFIEDCSLGW
jgi:hypothetical protein